MVRIVLTADNHLNAYYRKMSPSQMGERRKALQSAFHQVIEFSLKNADIFLQAGDLFDSTEPGYEDILFALRCFHQLSEKGVRAFAIGGTHDTPKSKERMSPLRFLSELGVLHFFSKKTGIETSKVKVNGVEISIGGMSTNTRLPNSEDPLKGVSFPEFGELNILLLHYGIQGHYIPGAQDLTVPLGSLDLLEGVNLFAVGHYHHPRDFRIGEKLIIIPGATERMDFGEREESCGFYYLEYQSGKLDCQFIKVETQPMGQVVVRSPEIERALDPTSMILERIREASNPRKLLKLKVEGVFTPELYHQVQWAKVWQEGKAGNFFFDIDLASMKMNPAKPDIKTGGAGYSEKEEIKKVATALAEKASPSEREIFLDALDLIMEEYNKRR
ncbi:MAG: metallophosphoesterase [Caldiserica bacterium]|jgi:DNA repair exonuclease SbcCD nuclease subunit|nr:metallophosphoesterase [Caldisericota bacterium]MDH7561777.1 metallophosphoesterase [Caldisericota bacterium]